MNDVVRDETVIHVPETYQRRNVPTEVSAPEANPMAMLARAVAQGWEPERLKQLMDLQERWEKNEARKAFDEAMAAAKAEVPVILKTREVDFTSQKGRTHYFYEDLATIARAVDPILARHGLSYRFRTSSPPNEPVTVTCIVAHRAGHSEENTLPAGRDDSGNKNSIQAIGSTLTYLQRMTLKAALGLAASTDDDGRSVGGSPQDPEPDAEGKAALEACGSLNALQEAWKALTAAQRKTLAAVKEECKQRIQEADKA